MSAKERKSKSDEYKWISHIQVHFNDEDIAKATLWLQGRDEDLARSVDSITAKETAVKVTLDPHRASYQFTLQPKARSSPYRGYTVGYGHVDLSRGMAIMEYIHDVLLDNEGVDIPTSKLVNDW